MRNIVFTSTLDLSYQGDLERMLFFNKNQAKVFSGASRAIDRYGMPRISIRRSCCLWVTFQSGLEAQSLFVLEDSQPKAELIGVAVYTREKDEIVVIFTAIREDYATGGASHDASLF